MTLKQLRIWHWQQVVGQSHVLRWHEARGLTNTIAHTTAIRKHSFHMKAVQALNEVVPGTAESDLAEERQ
jgi:hypothetical protein